MLQAFDISGDQLSGPDWMATERYEISAIVPEGATKDEFNAMLRNLLTDRFRIAAHSVKRDFDVYEVRVAGGGPKMKKSAAAEAPAPAQPAPADPAAIQARAQQRVSQMQKGLAPGARRPVDADGFPLLPEDNRPYLSGLISNGRMRINARGQSLADVARTLQTGLGARVVDKSGLTGLYDFKLVYAREIPGAPPADDSAEPAPDILSAAQSQLGLKLEKTRAPFDVLVIDHIEKIPAGN